VYQVRDTAPNRGSLRDGGLRLRGRCHGKYWVVDLRANCSVRRKHRRHEVSVRRRPSAAVSVPPHPRRCSGSTGVPGAGRPDGGDAVGLLAQGGARRSRRRSADLDQCPAGLARASGHCVGLREQWCVRHSPDRGLPWSSEARPRVLGRVLSQLGVGLSAACLPRRPTERDSPVRYWTPLLRLI
jgi:hypothetical protein